MRPIALGYIIVSAPDLADWSEYATGQLGLQRIDRSARTLAFRMDDRKQRVVVEADGGSTISAYGWEMADADALEALAARVEDAGIAVARAQRALCDARFVKDMVLFTDPGGNRVEVFHGPMIASDPFVPSRNIAGFRTGALGLGHAVLNSTNVKPLIAFYRDVMQFGVSDYYDQPFTGCFFHVNPRHHSFAIFEHDRDLVHHVMMEYFAMDDMGHGWDIAQVNERVAVTLGRHAGDDVLSFYTWTPSKFMIESGWGGKVIDPDTWEAGERAIGPSIWGHDRLWMPDDRRKVARDMMLKAAELGYRRKVNVLDGNYKLMPGGSPDDGEYVRDSADDAGKFSDERDAAE